MCRKKDHGLIYSRGFQFLNTMVLDLVLWWDGIGSLRSKKKKKSKRVFGYAKVD